MFDINFYMEFDSLLKRLNKNNTYSRQELFEYLENIRSKKPVIYNIETTNRCNMSCKMCPRTTMMTRPIEDIDRKTFLNVASQISPHSQVQWSKWKSFCEDKYGIYENEMSENHFFLYVIPKVIQLHGYGDPLLDTNMSEYIKVLSENKLYSYFSCNPANINLEKTYEMMDCGLSYIKYSLESIDDEEHKSIRGSASNFSKSYKDILKVLDYKHKKGLSTTVVITMLDLNRKNQKEDYEKLKKLFSDLDVYIYLKSEDCQWYRKDFHGTNSVHWSEICKHPWISMTIKSNGEATMCMEDFNNEIILGDTNKESLHEIWNGDRYKNFRMLHLEAKDRIKCVNECDMKLLGDCYKVI